MTRRRLSGYRAAAERHGIDWRAVPVWAGTDSTADQRGCGRRRRTRPYAPPTALLCLSDRLAEGAFRAAARLGLRIPDDLSIVAFDDARPLAATLNLTTVRQPSREKASTPPARFSISLPDTQSLNASCCPPNSSSEAPAPN
jgi:DNA-binding LacI/PurR family transcriptional regulator